MQQVLEKLRDLATKRGVTFMDARANERESTSAQIQDGKADKLSHSKSYGLGVRVLAEGAWGFATTNAITPDSAEECLNDAVAMAKASSVRASALTEVAHVEPVQDEVRAEVERDPRSVPLAEKMEMIAAMEKAAVDAHGDKLSNTVVSYTDSVATEAVCNTLGTLLTQETVRTRLMAQMTAQDGELRQRYHKLRSARQGYEMIEALTPDEVSVEAARTAVQLLTAERAPSGTFPVIFHPSITAFLVHEAFGHNAEADHVLGGESILAGRLGDQVTADCLTIVDDSTGPEESWGSYRYDSEGVPGQRRTIVENGVLTGFMHSLQTAAAMDVAPNGSARAESYAWRPQVRMSNTSIEPGSTALCDLLADTEGGILLVDAYEGHVMTQRGQYTLRAGQGFWIRDGEPKEQIRDVGVSGMTLETLMSADAVSQEWELAMPGTCGKGGQGMPVNGGGPHVRVHDVVLGGQE